MTDSRAALDMDRLPWLTDERPRERTRKPRRKVGWAPVVPWALLAGLLVAGVSYWLGMRSMSEPGVAEEAVPPRSVATTTLAPPVAERVAPAEPTVIPEVKPVAEPAPVRIAPVKSVRKPRVEPRRAAARPDAKGSVDRSEPSAAKASPKPAKLEYWPAIESTGASGRMVRIGTFNSRRQAKKGWWAIVRHYPGMRNLKAVVAPLPSLRDGRTYYRLQFGTTSQAHSTILCQRMRMIAQSCVVVGLPQGQGGAAR